jgi:hypothetical protein
LVSACYHIPEDKIIEFCRLLVSGHHETADDPVWRLREFVNNSGVGHGGDRSTVYRKTEMAIKHFADGKTISGLSSAKTELFPIPGVDL